MRETQGRPRHPGASSSDIKGFRDDTACELSTVIARA